MPNDSELCSLTDLKSYLQVTTTPGALQAIKDAVEQFVISYTGRDLLVPSTAYTEYYDGDGSTKLIVNQRPIISITSIYTDPARIWDASTLVPSSDILSDPVGWRAGIIELFQYRFLTGRKGIKVTYSAGYATVPADLKLAVKLICAKLFKVQDKGLFAQISQQVGDMTVNLSPDAMPKDALAILDRYKRMVY